MQRNRVLQDGFLRTVAGATTLLLIVGCGGGDGASDDGMMEEGAGMEDAGMEDAMPAETEMESTMPARVMIVEPADGAEVEAGPLRVVMEVEGLEIVSAGNMDPGTGHHHLIVNGDVDWAVPIPNDPGVHYHMGQAQTEFTLEDLPTGEHRIIAVVADGVHIPLDPPVADTITVVVR